MRQTDLDAAEERAHGCAVRREVGKVPRDERAGGDGRLQAADEGVTVDGLNHLVRWLCKRRKNNTSDLEFTVRLEQMIYVEILEELCCFKQNLHSLIRFTCVKLVGSSRHV